MLVLDMVFIVLLYQASLLRRNNIFFDTHCTHGTRNDDFFFSTCYISKYGLGILLRFFVPFPNYIFHGIVVSNPLRFFIAVTSSFRDSIKLRETCRNVYGTGD